jgi:3-methyladenine DNA glycosylase AlkD
MYCVYPNTKPTHTHHHTKLAFAKKQGYQRYSSGLIICHGLLAHREFMVCNAVVWLLKHILRRKHVQALQLCWNEMDRIINSNEIQISTVSVK